MTRIRTGAIRKLDVPALKNKIQETRGELTRLRTDAAKGTLRKENGKISALKHDIARMLTVLNEMKEQ